MKKPQTIQGMYLIIEDICKKVDIHCPDLPSNKILARLPKEVVQEGKLWLTEIFEHEYKDVYDIRKLLSEDIWKFYDAFYRDFKDHREVKLLKERSNLLEYALMKLTRPDLFIPKRVTKVLKEMRMKKKRSKT